MYDPKVVEPMRRELTSIGVKELLNPQDVDAELSSQSGTTLLVINSVCGCAAGGARPGVALALKHAKKPNKVVTVFAGQDEEATAHARSYFPEFPPSSPSMALFKDGEVVEMIPRQEIEGFSPEEIAAKLTETFEKFC